MDFQNPKILVPAILFALLSPGMLLSLPSMNFASGRTSVQSVMIHALVFVLAYWALSKSKLVDAKLTKYDLIVPAVLFLLLSPGMLLTLPPGGFMNRSTSVPAVGVHTIVFILLFAFLRKQFPQFY